VRARARSGLRRLCFIALAAAGCGGGSTSGGGGSTSGGGGGEVVASGGGPLTEAECMQLLEHFLEVAMVEKRATLPPDQVPTDEQVERIRVQMRDEARRSCIGRTEREHYDCLMKARTTRGLNACLAGREQGT
jgi:hypothetical protein